MSASTGLLKRSVAGTRSLKTLLLLAVVASFSAIGLYAQTFGEITGIVTDASGAVMSGASITLTNTNTNAVRKTTATDAGVYTFPSVPPGLYVVKTEVQGFKTGNQRAFSGSRTTSSASRRRAASGDATETIEVTSEVAQLQSENATLGTVIENKIVTELPLTGC